MLGRTVVVALLLACCLALPSAALAVLPAGSVPQCSDGIDNDGDGKIDGFDGSCSSPSDDDEANPPQCSDTQDNDGDGRIDLADPGC